MENYASAYWKIIDRSYRQDEQEAMARFAREQLPTAPRPDPLDRIAKDMGFIRTEDGFILPEEDIEF